MRSFSIHAQLKTTRKRGCKNSYFKITQIRPVYRRTDNETLDRRRNQARSANRRNVEYVSVTNVSKDGQMTSSQFKMDDSKMGETRIDELSGKDIKRKLIRAMQEVF